MKKVWLSVDFNERIDCSTVMLSQTDTRRDSRGGTVVLYEGLPVVIYEEDVYADGTADFLIAQGVVIRHDLTDWPAYPHVKWFCRFAPESFQNRPEWRGDFHKDGFVILTESPGSRGAVSPMKCPKLPELPKNTEKV